MRQLFKKFKLEKKIKKDFILTKEDSINTYRKIRALLKVVKIENITIKEKKFYND